MKYSLTIKIRNRGKIYLAKLAAELGKHTIVQNWFIIMSMRKNYNEHKINSLETNIRQLIDEMIGQLVKLMCFNLNISKALFP